MGPQSVSLLWRRIMRPAHVVQVGKEANKLEAVEAGIEHEPDEI